MGLSGALARLAVRATRVLVVEVPGHWATRMEVEHQLLRRGWRPAWTPADADVLAVCGVPGPELSELVDRLWEQMPGPRVRADITSPGTVGSALDDAAALLLDTPQHRTDAQERAQEPEIRADQTGWIEALVFMASAPLSDAEMTRLIEASGHPGNRRLGAILNEAATGTFVEIARNLGRASALRLQGERL